MVNNDQSRPAAMPTSWADPAVSIPRGSRWRRALPLLVWLASLATAVILLHALGDGRLAAPPLTDPGAWSAWAAAGDPLEVAMVVLRLLALGLAWYLTGVTSISIIARLLRAARLVRIADALSFGPVKVLVQQALGIGLAASVLVTAIPGTPATVAITPLSQASQPDATPVTQPGPAAPEVSLVVDDEDDPAPGRAVLAPVPAPRQEATPPAPTQVATPSVTPESSAEPTQPAEPAGPTEPAVPTEPPTEPTTEPPTEPTTASSEPPAAPPGAPPGAPVAPPADTADAHVAVGSRDRREVRVEPGDHFWAIAEADVARHLGRPGTDVEVVAHWQAILEANADRLPVPGNPDVLFPGQMVLLPAMVEVGS